MEKNTEKYPKKVPETKHPEDVRGVFNEPLPGQKIQEPFVKPEPDKNLDQ